MSVFVKEGSIRELDLLIFTSVWTWYVGLFTDDITPDEDTEITDLTPPTGEGYAAQTPVWGPVVLNGEGNAQSTALLLQFLLDSGQTPESVYGWYLYTDVSSVQVLHHAERLVPVAGPPLTIGPEDIVNITPRKTLGRCPPAE
jgi:hypothetical protein